MQASIYNTQRDYTSTAEAVTILVCEVMMQRINYIFNLISQSGRFLTLIPSAQSLISEAHFIMLKSFSPIKIICTLESLENGNFECINSTFELNVTAKTFVRIFIRKKINRKNEKN